MNDVETRIRTIVAKQLDVSEEKVTLNASFINDLGADSLDVVELVMTLEEEFGCEIPDDLSEKLVTPKDVIEYIQQNVKIS